MVFLNDKKSLKLIPNKIMVFNPHTPHRLLSFKDVNNYFVLHVRSDKPLSRTLIDSKEDYDRLLNLQSEPGYIEDFLKRYEKQKDIKKSSPLEKIKEYIESRTDKEITLKELAQIANLSESYLSRAFKEEYGLSPINYSINQKIHYSKILLQNGMDISAIAQELGFYDQAHFYKAFKSIFYITPKEYQNLTR